MFTHTYTGTFIADKSHDWNLEKELQDEMQEIADWAGCFESIGGETFEQGIKQQVEALNIQYKKTNRRYEAYTFYEDYALVHVREYKKEPNSCNEGFWIPTTIGDYRIKRKS